MKNLSFLLIGAALLSASCNAQNSKGFTKLSGGLEYQTIVKGAGNQSVNIGDVAEIQVIMRIDDSIMLDTRQMNGGQPVPQPMSQPTTKGELMEGLILMKPGDSTLFRMNFDSLVALSKQPKPDWVKPGAYAYWEVKMFSVKTQQQMQKEADEAEAKQKSIDDGILQDYFKQNNITNYKKTESGLYYVIIKQGTGNNPEVGQTMTMNYTGMLLNGEKFDSNTDPNFHHVQPFDFKLGQGMVIKGWDEGIALLNKGSKAVLYIPSHLGYGARGAGDKIPGNSILIFDVELVDFK